MPKFNVNLNWDQKRIPNITANTDENPNVFKDQLLELTGVHPYRQKVILNGIALKDDYWNITLQDDITLTLLGSVDELPGILESKHLIDQHLQNLDNPGERLMAAANQSPDLNDSKGSNDSTIEKIKGNLDAVWNTFFKHKEEDDCFEALAILLEDNNEVIRELASFKDYFTEKLNTDSLNIEKKEDFLYYFKLFENCMHK